MSWDPDKPYNALAALPPRAEVDTKRILRATIEARAAVAALDQAAHRIPNPSVLINAIPLLEAQASSEIENIVTTTDELFRYAQADDTGASAATKETLRYRAALFAGLESIKSRPLSTTTAIEVCSMIHRRDMTLRRLPGTKIANPMTKKAVYTPPFGGTVIADLLDNWEQFLHSDHAVDPLVAMAIAHYQFEAIHPFDDGNGRTGRILNVLYLVDAGLLRLPILYLSRYIIRNKDDYYRLLLAVTSDAAWEAWILFVLEGVRQTTLGTLAKIDAVHAAQAEVKEGIRNATSAGPNSDLLDVLFEHPYCRISNVMARCAVSRPTATNWLNALVAAGTLVDVRIGRERLFLNTRFIDALEREERIDSAAEPTLF